MSGGKAFRCAHRRYYLAAAAALFPTLPDLHSFRAWTRPPPAQRLVLVALDRAIAMADLASGSRPGRALGRRSLGHPGGDPRARLERFGCHTLAGDVDHAREVFERAIDLRKTSVCSARRVEPETGEPIGNVPQAFSHVGLVNAAWAIHEAESRP
ncbi:MAG: hypothetical protein KY462_09895 [Actinobacteria bacterium]|nr:hypothetical protein [Actinomycetota bacterium]